MKKPKGESWIHWSTPGHFVRRLDAFGGIALDPCWNQNALTDPTIACDGTDMWLKDDGRIDGAGNGLRLDWCYSMEGLNGIVFVNPPYALGAINKWADKIILEARGHCPIIALVAARPSTRWNRDLWDAGPSGVLDWSPYDERGRISFINPPPWQTNKLAPSVESRVFAFNIDESQFKKAFRNCGIFMRRSEP